MTHFIVTKEHRRFVEFAHAVRKQRTIGICVGPAGVGKTVSARRYTRWDTLHPFLQEWGPRQDSDAQMYALASKTRTAFYTPAVLASPKAIHVDLDHEITRLGVCIEQHRDRDAEPGLVHRGDCRDLVDMVIIDESERLGATTLEVLRDEHDRSHRAMVLIGMPGLDKRFSHYPQLYSRLGFAHQYRPLTNDELLFVLGRQWKRLGQDLNTDDFTDAQAVAAIQRITRGNFRLLERLLPQIQRVLKINDLSTITDDVIEAAASTLVIGA